MYKFILTLAVVLLLCGAVGAQEDAPDTVDYLAGFPQPPYFGSLDSALEATPDGQYLLVDFYTDW